MRYFAIALLCVRALTAQSFEVASVKRIPESNPKANGSPEERNGAIAYRNMHMKVILMRAFDLQDSQIIGPDWLWSERYDIDARLPQGATQDQVPAMLQSLLAERFGFKWHMETREGQVDTLVIAKKGTTLKPAESAVPYKANTDRTGRHLHQAFTMANFARFLSLQLQAQIIDETGLNGLYDMTLNYMPGAQLASMSARGDDLRDAAPPLRVAIEQQLGLKLEARKGPVKTLVIDHMERIPTEN
jgi:uncharacterized protein (TIGR03435 family)